MDQMFYPILCFLILADGFKWVVESHDLWTKMVGLEMQRLRKSLFLPSGHYSFMERLKTHWCNYKSVRINMTDYKRCKWHVGTGASQGPLWGQRVSTEGMTLKQRLEWAAWRLVQMNKQRGVPSRRTRARRARRQKPTAKSGCCNLFDISKV